MGLVRKMKHVHYFAYLFFRTYPKFMKLVPLENRLNQLPG